MVRMANEGVYREAGPLAGLPLPRARLSATTTAVVVTAGLALLLPPVVFVSTGRGLAGAWQLFREGGFAMYLTALLGFVAPLAAAALGVPLARGRRVPSLLLLGCVAAPFMVSMLGTWFGQSVTLGALRGDAVDPEVRARILAEGFAESMTNDVLGGLVTCGVALLACVAGAGATGTLDVARATDEAARLRGAGGGGGASTPTLSAVARSVWILGGVWFAAAVGIAALRLRELGTVALLPVLPLVVVVPAMAFAGRGTRILREWHDRAEASHALGAVVVAGVAALVGVLALQRGIESRHTATWLSAVASQGLDPSQRLAILQGAVVAGRLVWPSYLVHVILGGATVVAAVTPALGSAPRPGTQSTHRGARAGLLAGLLVELVGAGLAALLLAGCALGIARMRDTTPQRFDAEARAALPGDVTLPTLHESLSNRREHGTGARVVVPKNSPPQVAEKASHYDLYADAAATLGAVRASLPGRERTSVTWYGTHGITPEQEASLGPLAYYLGTVRSFEAMVTDDPYEVGTDELRVVTLAEDALEIDGKRVAFPLPASEFNRAVTPRKERVRYTFRPSDTVAHAVRVIESVEKAHMQQLVTWEFQRTVVIDDGSKAAGDMRRLGFGLPLGSEPRLDMQAGTTAGTVPGTSTVSGRLPPEVIQRIVRQNFARFRKCYEDALQRTPGLEGRVTVRFVIDTSGSVVTANDAGSTLPDTAVVQCVVRGFKGLTFPKPEGGIVTVVYPVEFRPAPKPKD